MRCEWRREVAKNRMIKVEFFTSKTLAECSPWANLLFIGLWTLCDDFGVCLRNIPAIFGSLFPLRDDVTMAKVEKWLDELVAQNLIISVEHNGKPFLIVRNWDEHQYLSRPSKRRWLQPQEQQSYIRAACQSHVGDMSVTCQSHVKNMSNRNKKEETETERERETEWIMNLWNEVTTPPIPRCASWDDARHKKAQKMLKAYPDPGQWRAAFSASESSPFCRGENDRGWTVDIDRFLDNVKNSFQKALEGSSPFKNGAKHGLKYEDTVEGMRANGIPETEIKYILERDNREGEYFEPANTDN